MDDLAAVGAYFTRKAAEWTSTDGSARAYLRRVKRNGLVAEFRSDHGFDDVRRYLRRVSDVQYVLDARYSEFATKVKESLLGSTGNAKGVQRQVSLIVRAAFLAYGVMPFGQRLVRVAGALPR